MKKHTKKLLSIGLSAALIAPLALSNQGLVNAVSNAPTEGKVIFNALDDTKKIDLDVVGKKASLTRLDSQTGSLVDYSKAWNTSVGKDLSSTGEVTFDSVKSGKYALTLQVDDKTNVTRFFNYTAKKSDTKTSVVVPLLDKFKKVDSKVTGSIGGTIEGGKNTKVAIVGKDTTWTTTADENGKFRVYLPTGTYDVVVIGNDTVKDDVATDDMRNEIYKSIKVVAGQNASPFDEMIALNKWEDKENELGLNLGTSLSSTSKEYKGSLAKVAKVSAYTVVEGDKPANDVYTLLGESIAKTDKTGKTTFSIKLKKAQPDQKIAIVVEDEALNRYVYSPDKLAKINPQLKPDTTKNEIGQPIELTFTDATKSYELSDTFKVTAKLASDSGAGSALKKKAGKDANDFSVSSGKITINPSVFSETGDYEITVTSPGFEDQTITQKIGLSTVKVAALTVKAEKGSAEGSTKLTASAGTDNTLKYNVSNAVISTPVLYTKASVDLKAFDGKDITGVDASSNKYVGVYEINKDGQIVKFKLVTLTAAQINPVKTP